MAVRIEFPKGVNVIEYLSSFATAFIEKKEMHAALLGMQDNLRQAKLISLEPLGTFACLTAEEEAATFLYYALLDKGYSLPDFHKLRGHSDKVKFAVLASVLQEYFFNRPEDFSGTIRVERGDEGPQTTLRIMLQDFDIIQDDPFETIATIGNGEDGHNAAVKMAIDKVIKDGTPKGFTIKSHIKNVANRRNLCLYGSPSEKLRFTSEDEMKHFRDNCVVLVFFGFLIINGESRTLSLEKLIGSIFNKLSA